MVTWQTNRKTDARKEDRALMGETFPSVKDVLGMVACAAEYTVMPARATHTPHTVNRRGRPDPPSGKPNARSGLDRTNKNQVTRRRINLKIIPVLKFYLLRLATSSIVTDILWL